MAAPLPPARRIVTGHSPAGKAIVESDTTFTAADPRIFTANAPKPDPSEPALGFINLWRTPTFPAPIQGPWEEFHAKPIELADPLGTTLRIVDFPPHQDTAMHRTVSLDFGIVLKGTVVMELDDGACTVVGEGTTVVQRGTSHAWYNRSDEWARMAFVLLPSQKVIIGGEELEPHKFTHE